MIRILHGDKFLDLYVTIECHKSKEVDERNLCTYIYSSGLT